MSSRDCFAGNGLRWCGCGLMPEGGTALSGRKCAVIAASTTVVGVLAAVLITMRVCDDARPEAAMGDSPTVDDSAAPVLTPEIRDLCKSFREKKGSFRLAEARHIQAKLLQEPIPVPLVIELLGEPDSRSGSFMTYSLGFDGKTSFTMDLSVEEGRASVFGFGGGS